MDQADPSFDLFGSDVPDPGMPVPGPGPEPDVPGTDIPMPGGPELPGPGVPDLPGTGFPGDLPGGPTLAQGVPLTAGRAPGSPKADGSEPQIPDLRPADAAADGGPESFDDASDPRPDPEADGAVPRPAQRQARAPHPDRQDAFRGAGYPTADLDGPEPEAVSDATTDAMADTILDRAPDDGGGGGDAVGGGGAGASGDPTADVTTDMDPELSHAIPDVAPPEEGIPEDAPVDVSIFGDGHADKAAWNRARTQEAQPGYDAAVAGRTPGSSEDMGYPGGAPDESVPGLDTGDGILDDLIQAPELDEGQDLDDIADALDNPPDEGADPIEQPPRGARGEAGIGATAHYRTFLPEHRDQPDEDRGPEELLIADENEDAMFGAGELGDTEDLEMEDLNETDDISRAFEDGRADLDDAASGNERQGL